MNDFRNPFVIGLADEVLVLASRSPRRAELLKVAGIPFTVVPPGDVEHEYASRLQGEALAPGNYAEALALAKAQNVRATTAESIVLGADTIVLQAGKVLEKPQDEEEACAMLAQLAGRGHTVVTALALIDGRQGHEDRVLVSHEQTRVSFLPLDEGQIRAYVATGEPMDKAGAYGIQGLGALMVSGVKGCYFNVMGLPLARLGQMLRELLGTSGEGA